MNFGVCFYARIACFKIVKGNPQVWLRFKQCISNPLSEIAAHMIASKNEKFHVSFVILLDTQKFTSYLTTKFSTMLQYVDIDRIEYDAARLKYLTYKMASVRVGACVCACAVEIKPGMLRAACFFDVRV